MDALSVRQGGHRAIPLRHSDVPARGSVNVPADVDPSDVDHGHDDGEDEYEASERHVKAFGSLSWSRALVYLGSLVVLASSMVASLPDYIGAAKLHDVLPHCAPQCVMLILSTR